MLRKQKDWSRSFLADKLDISVSFLTMVELGQRGVSLALVEDIASVFKIPIPYLFVEQEITQSNEKISLPQLKALEAELRESLNTSLSEFFEEKSRA